MKKSFLFAALALACNSYGNSCCCGDEQFNFEGFSIGLAGIYSAEKVENDLFIYQVRNDETKDASVTTNAVKETDYKVANELFKYVANTAIAGKASSDEKKWDDGDGNKVAIYNANSIFSKKAKEYSCNRNVGGANIGLAYKRILSNSNVLLGVSVDGSFTFKNKKTKNQTKEKVAVINIRNEKGGIIDKYYKSIVENFADPIVGSTCYDVRFHEKFSKQEDVKDEENNFVGAIEVVRYDETKAPVITKRSSFKPSAYFTVGYASSKTLFELGCGISHIKVEQNIADSDIGLYTSKKSSKITPSIKAQISRGISEKTAINCFVKYDFNTKKNGMRIKNNYTLGIGANYRI